MISEWWNERGYDVSPYMAESKNLKFLLVEIILDNLAVTLAKGTNQMAKKYFY